jgi:hypothetical protein
MAQNVVTHTAVIDVDDKEPQLLPYLTADVEIVVEK